MRACSCACALRGLEQSLQALASTFAGQVAIFCGKLHWWQLHVLCQSFQDRLETGAQPDVVELARVPHVKTHRARALLAVQSAACSRALSADRGLSPLSPCSYVPASRDSCPYTARIQIKAGISSVEELAVAPIPGNTLIPRATVCPLHHLPCLTFSHPSFLFGFEEHVFTCVWGQQSPRHCVVLCPFASNSSPLTSPIWSVVRSERGCVRSLLHAVLYAMQLSGKACTYEHVYANSDLPVLRRVGRSR